MRAPPRLLLPLLCLPLLPGCFLLPGPPGPAEGVACRKVEDGFGPAGQVPFDVEVVARGLEVPWGLAWLPSGDALLTERPGRVRLLRADGTLEPQPVATLAVGDTSEGGLLGITVHPGFAGNRQFYLYVTTASGGEPRNSVERWVMAPDGRSAQRDRVILEGLPAAQYHNGGRLRFGPDGMLYVGTGDARDPDLAQAPGSNAGKLLRLTPDGAVPSDNPTAGSPVFLSGIRNTQGFDWLSDALLVVTDHGPSGELGRRAGDEVSVARAGDNLGWPPVWGCETGAGKVTPLLTWGTAVPPGGAAVYRGSSIPEWRGSLMMATLGSRHLQRVQLDAEGRLLSNEVYLQDAHGRLREVAMGPDGHLYVTTSNCDGRGDCPPEKDLVLRLRRR
jgi:glucose/arabinose dehydrogenase